jgi:hypothetical protein
MLIAGVGILDDLELSTASYMCTMHDHATLHSWNKCTTCTSACIHAQTPYAYMHNVLISSGLTILLCLYVCEWMYMFTCLCHTQTHMLTHVHHGWQVDTYDYGVHIIVCNMHTFVCIYVPHVQAHLIHWHTSFEQKTALAGAWCVVWWFLCMSCWYLEWPVMCVFVDVWAPAAWRPCLWDHWRLVVSL